MTSSANLFNRYLRPLAFSLPLLGVLVASGITVPRVLALRADEETLIKARSEINTRKITIEELHRQPQGVMIARVPATRDEPVEFLRSINLLAARCGVRLTRIQEAAPTPEAAANATSGTGTPAAPALPADTRQVILNLNAEGGYQQLARFFAYLETYPRLISVSQASMRTIKFPVLTAQFNLTRYTGPPPTGPPTAEGAAAPVPLPVPAPTPQNPPVGNRGTQTKKL